MKKITFRAEEELIEKAREVARRRGTTLNTAFQEWLVEFTERAKAADEAMKVIEKLGRRVRVKPPYTRDEMNER
jgi:hypothetical protein